MVILEICCQSFEAAINAYTGGADRIELCIDLPSGGRTPDPELIKKVKKHIPIPVYVLVRPRAGNFIYNDFELHHLLLQIKESLDFGADGIVTGALTKDQQIDIKALTKMKLLTGNIPFTFHRAIEQVSDWKQAIDALCDFDVHRLLSGGKNGNAFKSCLELKEWNNYINSRLILLPGSGITSENVKETIKTIGCQEIHSSAKYGNTSSNHSEFDSNPTEVALIKSAIGSLG